VEKDYAFSARHNYVVKVPNRDGLADWMRDHRVGSGMHYIPNHLYDMYKPYATSLPVIEEEWLKLLTLPLHPNLTNEDVAYIIEVVRRFPQ
jgi:perosamine synthetase